MADAVEQHDSGSMSPKWCNAFTGFRPAICNVKGATLEPEAQRRP